MKKISFVLALSAVFMFVSCDKDDSENEKKDPQPTKIVTVEQAESVARNLWQLISNINDNIDDGYEYSRKTINAPNLGEFVITGVKYTDQDNCTITALSECVLNNVEYSGYTFNGSFQYQEKNYHYNSNYKRICKLWSSVDESAGVYMGIEVKGGMYNVDDFIYVGAEKNNYVDKRYNCDRTPADFTIITSAGDKFTLTIK